VHGALAGTDATSTAYQVVAWILLTVTVAAGLVRVLIGRGAARNKPERRAHPVATATPP
jgi:hypothetical protein